MKQLTLAEVGNGERVRVVRRNGGRGFAANLDALGIHLGDEVVVVGSGPFQGPVLVEVPNTGVKIAVGRGMAEKLVVEPVDETG